MFPVICYIRYYSDTDDQEYNDCILLYAEDLADAGQKIEDEYGHDILSKVTFELLADGYVNLDDNTAEAIKAINK